MFVVDDPKAEFEVPPNGDALFVELPVPPKANAVLPEFVGFAPPNIELLPAAVGFVCV